MTAICTAPTLAEVPADVRQHFDAIGWDRRPVFFAHPVAVGVGVELARRSGTRRRIKRVACRCSPSGWAWAIETAWPHCRVERSGRRRG